MKIYYSRIKLLKNIACILSIIIGLGLIFAPEVSSQTFPYYPYYSPVFFNSFYYSRYFPITWPSLAMPDFLEPAAFFFPPRNASALTAGLTATLLPILLVTPTAPATTPLIGVTTAITLAAGGGVNITTLATLQAITVPTVPTVPTTTPTIGTTTLLLLGGGVNTTTLLLLGI